MWLEHESLIRDSKKSEQLINNWSVKCPLRQTKSSKPFLGGFLFYHHRCKAWSDPWERREMVGEDWTTSRLLSPSISLHVAVSFVCQSKGCWMGVNWNQFPLSDTINGVARTGQKGGCSGPLVTDPAAQACQEFATWNLPCDNNKPTPFQTHLLFCTHMDTS